MPVHDWTRVSANIFHDFHNTWIAELRNALNEGGLPPDYYALTDQTSGQTIPDVLTLQHADADDSGSGNGTAVAARPPRVRVVQQMDETLFVRKRRTVTICHNSDDRIVALIEILSPGNKASSIELRRFLDKAIAAMNQGIHLLLVDLFPPTKRDPNGIHGAILAECDSVPYEQPADKPLTLASYSVGVVRTAYVEPFAVGDELAAMPIFLTPETYVDAPLEATYRAAFRGEPKRYRDTLEKA